MKVGGRELTCIGVLHYNSISINFLILFSRLSARGDHIVIMSIHQPRYSIFKLLDTLTLLSAGNVVYHGQANNALEFFNTAGSWSERSIEVFQ